MTREDHYVCAALAGILGGSAFAVMFEEAIRRKIEHPQLAAMTLAARYAMQAGLTAAKMAEAPHVARVNGAPPLAIVPTDEVAGDNADH